MFGGGGAGCCSPFDGSLSAAVPAAAATLGRSWSWNCVVVSGRRNVRPRIWRREVGVRVSSIWKSAGDVSMFVSACEALGRLEAPPDVFFNSAVGKGGVLRVKEAASTPACRSTRVRSPAKLVTCSTERS